MKVDSVSSSLKNKITPNIPIENKSAKNTILSKNMQDFLISNKQSPEEEAYWRAFFINKESNKKTRSAENLESWGDSV